jgi:pyruvate dehydrogenase (quinone)
MSNMIAETIVDTLDAAGVRRVYGTPGDWLNGFTYALRHRRDM